MMKAIYPDLQPGAPGYRTKHNSIKKLRVLGKRLHILAQKFGRGMLGLLSPLDTEDGTDGALPDHV